MIVTPSRHEYRTREQRYQQMRARVADLTDTLENQVDAGIFETVVYLNLLGMHTFQSCEGHVDHGYPYPWVTLIDQGRSRQFKRMWMRVCELEEQARASGTTEAFDRYFSADVEMRALTAKWEASDPFLAQITEVLDGFYADRETNVAHLLVKRPQPGTYRIEPGFSRLAEEIPASLKACYLKRGQAEMQAFTAYLKQLFFE